MKDSLKTSDSPERRREPPRRGFLRRAGTVAAGGLAPTALPKPMTSAPKAPVLSQAGTRPGEPYFFRIEAAAAARTATVPALKEV